MTYQTVPIVVAGPSNQGRSRPLSYQQTVNFYQEYNEGNKSATALHSWYGLSLVGTGVGVDRGQHVMSGVRYRVAGTKLYELTSAGAHIDRGTIAGTARCIFADDGENMFIVVSDGSNVYQYSNVTLTTSSVTDSDIVGARAVTFINNQFIYTKPNLFVVSDVGNGSVASGLNAAQAESQPDDLIRAYAFDQVVYMIGENSVEPWYNSGSGSPPFDRIDTQIISVGCAAEHSIANNDNFLYWLGDDRQVYQAAGGRSTRVSSTALSNAIESYSTVSDAIAWTMTVQGMNFYVLTFPTADKTWFYNEGLGPNGGWNELSSGLTGGKYNCTSISYLNGEYWLAHESNGEIYRLDRDVYTENGSTIKRVRTLSSIHGGLFNQPGKRIQMSRFELILETGVGLISGQGEDPKIIIEASYDGGRSFSPGTFMRIGRLGETQVRAEWFSVKSFYDLIVRISTSDPVSYSIYSGAIDIKAAGR